MRRPLLPLFLTQSLLGLLALAGSGCSVGTSSSSESLALPTGPLNKASACTPLSDKGPPQVYRCTSAADSDEIFVTAVRDCSISEKFSHRATTRQLLVGFTNLKVLNQEPVSVGSQRVLRSVVAGVLDIDPVYVSTFTLRSGSCVTDLVMWKKSEEATRAVVGSLGDRAGIAHRFADATTDLAQTLSIAQSLSSPSLFENSPGTSNAEPKNAPPTATAIEATPKEVDHATLPTG